MVPRPTPKIVGKEIPALGSAASCVGVAPAIGVAVGPGVAVDTGVGVEVTPGVPVGVAVGVPVGLPVGVGVTVAVGVGVGVCPNVKARAWQAMGTTCALGLEVGAVGATASFLNW